MARPPLLQSRSHEAVLTTHYWDWGSRFFDSLSAVEKNHWQVILWGGKDPLLSKENLRLLKY